MIYEVVHSRLRSGAEEQMLALRPAMIQAVRERLPGLVDARLVKLEDGTWLDVVRWESREAADRAVQEFGDVPEHAAMNALIDEVLSFHRGVDAEPLTTDA